MMCRSEIEAVVAIARRKDERPNLSRAGLAYFDLSDMYLYRANLAYVNLRHANMSGADLRSANLARAKLSDTNLRGANLFDANLQGADLTGADLTGAYLTYANLTGARLDGAKLAYDPTSLIDHKVPEVRAWAAERVTDPTALFQLAMDDHEIVRTAVLENPICTNEMRVAAALQK
jgi:uncharacterized protein YjbI with pentapeptide repeats